jgi:hypothetical protein
MLGGTNGATAQLNQPNRHVAQRPMPTISRMRNASWLLATPDLTWTGCNLKTLAIRPAKTNIAFAVSPDYPQNGYLQHRLLTIRKVAMSLIESSCEIRTLRSLQVFCPVVFTCFANDENCGEGPETCHETRAFDLLAVDGGPKHGSDCGPD